jgi:CRP-like cAMP-binding protein
MSVLFPPRKETRLAARFLVSYPAGATIYAEGDVGTELFAIRSGEVEISRMARGETVVLARLRKGDFFGETSVLEDIPRDSTARARTDVALVRVNGAALEEMIRRNSDIAFRIMRKLSRQAREAAASAEKILATPGIPEPGARPGAEGGLEAPIPGTPQLVALDRKTRFEVNREGDTILGRSDSVTGLTPDVDLTPVDPQRTVSRRHARLYWIDDLLYVMEEIGVGNGTFVNDRRLATGAPATVRHGDDLRLGLVTLTFWNPVA